MRRRLLGKETLALGLFVKLKRNTWQICRLLSGFSKWPSNHHEENLSHMLQCHKKQYGNGAVRLICNDIFFVLNLLLYEWVACVAVHGELSRAAVMLLVQAYRTQLTQSERRHSVPEVTTPCSIFFLYLISLLTWLSSPM